MKAYAITINGDNTSENGYKILLKSSRAVDNRFFIERFEAVTPSNVDQLLEDLQITWNWPHVGSIHDKETGITKYGYGGKDPKRRRACGMSHYMLWKKCAEDGEPILIFEHDAFFMRRLDLDPLLESNFQVIGINSPHGATRLPNKFHEVVQKSNDDILQTPTIDKNHIAQGIAGASAYMIKPKAAHKLLELVSKHGMWNNDAIMCKQLMPGMLGVTKTYYTRVQNLPSTTMG